MKRTQRNSFENQYLQGSLKEFNGFSHDAHLLTIGEYALPFSLVKEQFTWPCSPSPHQTPRLDRILARARRWSCAPTATKKRESETDRRGES
jgi:hypothetical protein